MNRIYNSIWNEVTQAFVAVGEHVKGRGKRCSSRCEAPAEGPRQILQARPQMLALEARLMFDGAGMATVVEAEHQAEPAAEAARTLSEPVRAAPVDQGAAGQRNEIVFVEGNVANYKTLLDGLKPGTEVHVLDSTLDGLAQIAAALAGRNDIDALHILSHGAKGVLGLGSVTLTSENMPAHADKLAAIGASLAPQGDLLLYGCNIAAGAEGQAFVDAIARATQADVAASVDATGAAALGGNWVLESKSGDVADTRPISNVAYDAILPAPRVANPGTGNTAVYTRPGGISDTWSFGTCEIPGHGTQPTTTVAFGAGTLNRGSFEYSSNGGASWSTYNYDGNFSSYITVAGTTWRFVDSQPGDATTTNSFFIGYQSSGVPNSTTTSGMFVGPDTAPTDIGSNRNYVLSDAIQSMVAATLTPTDIGYTTGGVWVIDSQSVSNLFTIAPVANGNTATLSMGTGVLPAVGQTVTVTARYYDRYQTDNSNNPINGQGYAKTLTYTVVSATSQDLNFGDDLDVSSTSTRDQTNASVTTLSNGNFVSVWQSDGQGGEAAGQNGIYARIYDAMGAPQSAEFAITTAGNGVDEITPVVTALNGGRFAVAYTTTGTGRDIGYRIVEANGTVGGQLIANTATAGDQAAPTMTTLSDGSFVIAWTTGAAAGVQAQKFNAADGSKNGGELSLDASGGNVSPSLAALSDGSYVLAWGDSNSYNIKAVVSSAPSTVIDVTNDGLASSDVANSGLPAAKVVGLSGGGFVVAWSAYDAGYAQCDIYFQRYNNAGAAQGSITQANTSSTAATYKDAATLAALSGGGFVVGWQADTGDYDESGLFGRRFSATGVAVDGSDFEINQFRRGHQNTVALTSVGSDRFAAVWTDNSSDGSNNKGVEGRVLLPPNAAPVFVGATTTLSANENSSAIDIKNLLHISDSDNGQTLTWSQSSAPSHGTLSFNAATASSGGGDITPGGTITYTPTAGYTGSDSFTVQVSDGSGGTVTRTITVTVNDIDPVLANATISVNENVAGGSAVGTISATGDTNGLTYAITGGSGQGLFTINSSTGAISVAAGADLDYEAASSLTLTVSVDDEDADSTADATATVTVNLNNLAEPADQNFESSGNSGNTSTSRTIGNLVFSSNGPAQVDVLDDVNGFYSETFTNFTGKAIINDYTGSASGSITYFQFSSLGLADDFRLISLAANAGDIIGGFPSNFTITGYQGGSGGTMVAQVTGFNFAQGATYGAGNSAIVYSKGSAVY
ncbi:MAG: DUF4347 domain-containing protein, partial [Paucibacter sp.]|nr:DUF4347 domain-containing protein [Roseateles sp.]